MSRSEPDSAVSLVAGAAAANALRVQEYAVPAGTHPHDVSIRSSFADDPARYPSGRQPPLMSSAEKQKPAC